MNVSQKNSADRGNTALVTANDSLASENRNRGIPNANLGFTQASPPGVAAAEVKATTAFHAGLAKDSLATKSNETLILLEEEVSYINTVQGAPKVVPLNRSDCGEKDGEFMLDLRYRSRDEFEDDRLLGLRAIETFLNWRREMRGLSEHTIASNGSRLRRILDGAELVYDRRLAIWRPFTLREILSPGYGRPVVLAIKRALIDDFGLDDVGYDILRDLRVFCRSICDGGNVLDDGTDLSECWGLLACPLNDRDIPKRTVKTEVHLPRPDDLSTIYAAALDFAAGRKRTRVGYRTAVEFVLGCESGMRGIEICSLELRDQHYDRDRGPQTIDNPLVVENAKVGGWRAPFVESYGFELLRWFLETQRPKFTDDEDGWLLPSERGSRVSSGSFSETTGELISHLKEKKLLHEQFTFHSTRKVYATHFMHRNGDIDVLLRQCGWTNSGQLAVYLRPWIDSVREQERMLARAQSLRAA
jgi:integrase